MSKYFKQIKKLYDAGRYSKEIVAEYVTGGLITPEEYKLITKEDYVAPEECFIRGVRCKHQIVFGMASVIADHPILNTHLSLCRLR